MLDLSEIFLLKIHDLIARQGVGRDYCRCSFHCCCHSVSSISAFQIRDVRVSLNQMYAREHDNAAQECTLQSAPHRRTAAGKLWALGEALKRRLSAFGGAKS